MKAKNERKGQTNRTKHLSKVAFADLKEALEAALAFERGHHPKLNVTRIEVPGRLNLTFSATLGTDKLTS